MLSLVGVSGTSILSISVHLHAWRLPLFALALLLLAANLATAFRGAGQACRLPSSRIAGRELASAERGRRGG